MRSREVRCSIALDDEYNSFQCEGRMVESLITPWQVDSWWLA